jgi:apolipoprotein N-acyltransferase
VAGRLALAGLTGLILVLLFPPFGLSYLAPAAVAPLYWALGREFRPWGRFALGYAAGCVYWAGTCWWIAEVLAVHVAMGTLGGWGSFALFCVIKSAHFGLFGLLAALVARHWYGPPAAAMLWALTERSLEPVTLFGWLMLGDAGIDMGLPLRLAPWTGVHGLSFLFALTGSVLGALALGAQRQVAAWLALVMAPAALPPLPYQAPGRGQAVLVQPDLDAAADWSERVYAAAKTKLALLTRQALSAGKADVVLWPETPGPMFYETDPDLRVRVAEAAEAARAPVILGMIHRDAQNRYYNSAQLVSSAGEPVRQYDKMYLVPFGEYVPAPFAFVNQVSDEVGAYTPGEERRLFSLNGRMAGVFICYEAAVGPHVREFARQGANVLVNLSNDGYFFHTPAREQHLQLVRMRAAENRRWILRSTNNGITASIDPAGQVRAELPGFTAAAARMPFGFMIEQSFYTLHGDWFLWLGLIGVPISLAASQRPHFQRAEVLRMRSRKKS